MIDATAVNTGMNWTTVRTEKLAGMTAIVNQEQQRVAIGPGSGHFTSVRQVSCDAATMQRDTCGHAAQWPTRRRFYAAGAAAADAAACRQVGNLLLIITNISVGAQSTLGGKTFLTEKYV